MPLLPVVSNPKGGAVSKATRADVPEVLRARRIELVDNKGRVRMRIGPDAPTRNRTSDPEDFYTLELLGPDGERSIMLRVGLDGSHLQVGAGATNASISADRLSAHGTPRALMSLHGGGGLTSRYEVCVTEGRRPTERKSGPEIAFGARPATRDELLASLPQCRLMVEHLDTARASRGTATRARRHVRELAAEFGIDVPEWAQPAKRERPRVVAAR